MNFDYKFWIMSILVFILILALKLTNVLKISWKLLFIGIIAYMLGAIWRKL